MTRKNNWLLTAVQVGLLAWSGASFSADKVYVANEGADTVSVLDATSFKTLASVRVGKMPHNVQVSPDGKFAWVTNNGEPGQTTDASVHKGMAQGAHEAMAQPGAVWVIDTRTNAVVTGCRLACTRPMWWCRQMAALPTSPTAATTRSV